MLLLIGVLIALFHSGGVCGADVINDPLTKIVDSLLKGPGHQKLLYGLSGMRSLTMGRVYDAMQKKIRKFKDAKKKDKVEEIESWYPGVTKMDRSGYFLTIDDFNGAGTSIGSMFGCGKDVMIPLAEGIRDGTKTAGKKLPSAIGIHMIRAGLDKVAADGHCKNWWKTIFPGQNLETLNSWRESGSSDFLAAMARPDICDWLKLLAKYREYVTLQDFGAGHKKGDVIKSMRNRKIEVFGVERLKSKDHLTKNLPFNYDWNGKELDFLANVLRVQDPKKAAKLYTTIPDPNKKDSTIQVEQTKIKINYFIMYAFFRRTSKLGIAFATSRLGGIAFNEVGSLFHKSNYMDLFKEARPKGIEEGIVKVEQAREKAITSSEWKLAKDKYSALCISRCITFYSEGHEPKPAKLKKLKNYFKLPGLEKGPHGKLKKTDLAQTPPLPRVPT